MKLDSSSPAAPSTLETVRISAVGAQGDGIAPGPLFVPLTLPGELVEVSRQGGRADLRRVLEASPERVTPPCPHFGACGGCAFQHWEHGAYLAWKVEMIRLALSREGLETDFAPIFAAPPGSRRRMALHARKGRGGAVVGFKGRRSWSLTEIEVCPISDRRLVEALPALRRLAAPFLEHPKSAPTLHVTWTASGLDVDVTGVERRSGGLSADARMRAAEAAQVADMARVSLAGETVYQARQPVVRFGKAVVALPAGSFLQAVEAAEAEMARIATVAIAGANKVADLYCGAGAFTFRLAETAQVYAADSAEPAVRALAAATGTAPGLKAITTEARDLVRRPMIAAELKKIDAVVFDPPRAGAAEQSGEIARSAVSRVVGVSCDPATFARDARILVDAGFRLERVHPIDQFLWSPHTELVGLFAR
ncbi:class I SAM-dependent RNA methyltransferase [soil metagenome]